MEEEEERDKLGVSEFMKKYAKLWRNLFSKYANSGFSSKQVSGFDKLSEKVNQMNSAEMLKLLKDHGTYPNLVTKEEIHHLFRLINLRYFNRNDLQALDYNGFL
jgi:uncharacterized protein YcbX